MKKFSKPIFAIFLSIVIMLSSTVVSFAGEEGDPSGRCYVAVPTNSIQYNK